MFWGFKNIYMTLIRNYLKTFSILILVLFSCTEKHPSHTNYDFNIEDTILNHFPDINHETNLNTIIGGLSGSDCVEGSAIGFTGNLSRTYAYYRRLCQLSSDSLLFKLTRSSNSIVRVYAFKGLKEKNLNLSLKAKKNLQFDSAQVCFYTGDTKYELKVADYIKLNN
jgi:hypothetical protein